MDESRKQYLIETYLLPILDKLDEENNLLLREWAAHDVEYFHLSIEQYCELHKQYLLDEFYGFILNQLRKINDSERD